MGTMSRRFINLFISQQLWYQRYVHNNTLFTVVDLCFFSPKLTSHCQYFPNIIIHEIKVIQYEIKNGNHAEEVAKTNLYYRCFGIIVICITIPCLWR